MLETFLTEYRRVMDR